MSFCAYGIFMTHSVELEQEVQDHETVYLEADDYIKHYMIPKPHLVIPALVSILVVTMYLVAVAVVPYIITETSAVSC